MLGAAALHKLLERIDAGDSHGEASQQAAIIQAGVAVNDTTNHYHNPTTSIQMNKYAGGEQLPLTAVENIVAMRTAYADQWNREFRQIGKSQIA